MMRIRRTERLDNLRLYVVLIGMVTAFVVLAGSLWRLQVAHVSQFESRQNNQSLRRVRLPGIRGKIFDRNGLCLADNRPNYTIALFPEEIRCPGLSNTVNRAMSVVNDISEITGLEPVVDRRDILRHIHGYRPIPKVLWSDINPFVMARFAEQSKNIPGVDICTEAARKYPYGPYTSHLIGYVGEIEPEKSSDEEKFNYNLDEMVGRAGLEKLFDPFLRGEAGAKLVQVDVGIYRYRDLALRAPKRGGDIRLTLDMEIQLLAHQALGDQRGSVVVLDPNNGDVLAMLSAPGFDANLFVPYITSRDWKRLSQDPDKPLLNRSVAGVYPPGSIYKPLVGLAASTVNPESIYTVYDSPSTFRIGRRTVHTHGHGEVDMQEAIEQSANVYFFKTALENGWEPIIKESLAIGLGKKTGVEVDFERPGLVPDAEWQRKTGHGGWTDGDTCNLSIGQGYLGVTPIQMAMCTATIANGGYLYKPRLVKAYREAGADGFVETPLRRVGKMNWSDQALDVVRYGMLDVIWGEHGTAKKARVDGLDFGGKTGTAEYGNKGKNHTWMIAFAPFDSPQYAIAFLIEDGASGGATVGPRLKILMEGLYKKMQREGTVPAVEPLQVSRAAVSEPVPNGGCS